MKQKILLLFAMLNVVCNVTAQWHPGAEININNVKTTLYGTGNFYRMRGSQKQDLGYYVPSTGNAYTIYSNTLWIGGLDDNDDLHLAAVRFNQEGEDFWSGPLRVNDASTDIFNVMKYHHVWKVTRNDIDALIANPGGDIPEDILTWPAHGNVADGFAFNLAPFVDVDYDGLYNPRNGDYPDIIGDMAVFCIYNDNYNYYNNSTGSYHGESKGTPLGIEIHCMLYGYNTPDDEKLNNTLFMRQWIYNRSSNTYHDTYIGYWTDFDIGYASDDYIGCNVKGGYYYGYNSSPIDGNGQDGSYGNNPPAQMVMVLGGPYMNSDFYDNPKEDYMGNQFCDESLNGIGFGDGIVDNEQLGMTAFVYYDNGNNTNTSDPNNPEDYYNYLRCRWKNGSPMLFGGTGYPGDVGTVGPNCNFMFPHDSDPCNWGTMGLMPNGGYNQNGFYWSEETGNNGGPNAPNDRRGLGVSGSFTFQSGEVEVIDRAFVTCWFTNGFDRNVMNEWANYIKNYYIDNIYIPSSNLNNK